MDHVRRAAQLPLLATFPVVTYQNFGVPLHINSVLGAQRGSAVGGAGGVSAAIAREGCGPWGRHYLCHLRSSNVIRNICRFYLTRKFVSFNILDIAGLLRLTSRIILLIAFNSRQIALLVPGRGGVLLQTNILVLLGKPVLGDA